MLLLHRFQQCGLRFRRSSVDFVCQQHIGKQRALHELKRPASGLRIILQNFGTGDVGGHQIGSELNPPKAELKNGCQCAAQQCFGQPRHTDQQHVATTEHCHQQFVDHLILTDDDATDFLSHFLPGNAESFYRLFLQLFG